MKSFLLSLCLIILSNAVAFSQADPETPQNSKHLLIVGSSGAVGGAVARHFAENDSYDFSTLTRTAEPPEGVRYAIKADLLEPESLDDSVDELSTVTHLFYAALKPNEDPLAEAQENETMLRTLLDALRKADAPLRARDFRAGRKSLWGPSRNLQNPCQGRRLPSLPAQSLF